MLACNLQRYSAIKAPRVCRPLSDVLSPNDPPALSRLALSLSCSFSPIPAANCGNENRPLPENHNRACCTPSICRAIRSMFDPQSSSTRVVVQIPHGAPERECVLGPSRLSQLLSSNIPSSPKLGLNDQFRSPRNYIA